ncbi:DUF29 domain-containing protein [Roseicella aquatilis]|uniref:DUF29 domain-containing protein n=1 Tax=Roseicella aquatilis TaxID=2527868 RepID=A0A4R4DUY4_9PROT|nr:DUF29 domain-containing protein [Roseicella aquatilis]TCZ65890.1 DUF29 domain-containing protein [Roseicella aquatilis]
MKVSYSLTMSNAADLYDRDFYAWTQDQAALLRAWPEALRPNALDIAHLAEEVEDLGGSQRSAVKNLIRQILVHLLKLHFHPDPLPRSHWQHEINEFRSQLDEVFEDSPSLRSRRAELASGAWQRAARQVCADLAEDGHASMAAAAKLFTAESDYFNLDGEVLEMGWFPP